jgi:uncharacterized protein YaaR (DUF327 family)
MSYMRYTNGFRQSQPSANFGLTGISGGHGGSASDGFHKQFGHQLKEDYRKRVTELFDEITGMAAVILDNADLSAFERYRSLIKELLSEVVNNAYKLTAEFVLDDRGRRRIYETISVIDNKLDEIASDILSKNSDRLEYISRVDEIRGLVLDMLL